MIVTAGAAVSSVTATLAVDPCPSASRAVTTSVARPSASGSSALPGSSWPTTIGATAARTDAPGPDPPGVREVARFGSGRILAIDGSRPEHLFVRTAFPARPGLVPLVPADPLSGTFLEGESRPAPFGSGTVRLLERTSSRHALRVRVEPPGGLLVVARTFDRSWSARVDGVFTESVRADGFLTALRVPAGEHEVVLACENPLIGAGFVLTLLSLLAGAILLRSGRVR